MSTTYREISRNLDIEKLAANRRRYSRLMIALGIFGGGLYGYTTVVLSGALVTMNFHGHGLTAFQQGVLTAGLLLGAAVGSFLGGSLADRYGRKKMIITGSCISLLACAACALATDFSLFLIARISVGLGVGFTSCVVPMAIGELASADKRGRFVSVNSVMINIAQLLATCVNAILAKVADWHAMLWASVVPALCLVIIAFLIHDTPNYFIRHGMDDQAVRVLLSTRDEQEAKQTYESMQTSLASTSRDSQHAKKESFSTPWLRRVLIVGIGLAVMQQFSGVNAINFFAPTIFSTTLGFGSSDSVIAMVPVMLVSAIAAVVFGLILIDKIDRRTDLLIGTAGVTVFLTAIGICYLFIQGGNTSKAMSWTLIAIMMIYLLFAQGSMAPVTWLMIAEIFPTAVRGQGMAYANIAVNTSSFILTLIFPVMLEKLGGAGSFFVFALINAGAFLFTKALVPETRGKTLAQIEAEARQRVK